MTDPADRALQRLRDPDGDALRQLAVLVVRETTATPLRELATARWIAGQIATALEALTRGDVARRWVDERIAQQRSRLQDEERPLRHWVPEEVDAPLRKLVGKPWTPSEELTLRIIDQPAVRKLLDEVLEDTVRRFAQRVRNLEKGFAGGLGGRAVRRGRGLFQNLAGDLVGAVAEEFEEAFERRIREYVGQATGRAMKTIVRRLSDPEDAETFGQLRVAVLDVLLDTPVKELAGEADAMNPEEIVDIVVQALKSAVSADDFVDRTTERMQAVLDEAGDGTLAAWLDEVGLTDVWTDTTVELVTARLAAVVTTDDFVTWWSDLHG
jgi:hypothetical protein